MTTAATIARAKILAASRRPAYVDDLSTACVIPGEFGLSAWGVRKLINSMVLEGSLVVAYDALNLRTVVAAR
jgi:hypothetical protein